MTRKNFSLFAGLVLAVLACLIGRGQAQMPVMPTFFQAPPPASTFANAQSGAFTNGPWLSIATNLFGDYNHTNFSVSFWYRASAGNIYACAHTRSGGNQSWRVQFLSTGKISFDMSTNGSAFQFFCLSTNINTDTAGWHNVIISYDMTKTTSAIARLDGTLLTWTNAVYPTTPLWKCNDVLTVGATETGGQPWNGWLDEFALIQGSNIVYADVQSGGHPSNLAGFPGLVSWLRMGDVTSVTNDSVLASKWQNNGGAGVYTTNYFP